MTVFTNPFGAIQTSVTSYQKFIIPDSNPFYLSWNNVAAAPDANLFSSFMYFESGTEGATIIMPPADESGTGQNALMVNTGVFDIYVKDSNFTPIVTLKPRLIGSGADVEGSYLLILVKQDERDWDYVMYGVSSASFDPSSFAGHGLETKNSKFDVILDSLIVPNTPPSYEAGDNAWGKVLNLVQDSEKIEVGSVEISDKAFFYINNTSTIQKELRCVSPWTINENYTSISIFPKQSFLCIIYNPNGTEKKIYTLGYNTLTNNTNSFLNLDLKEENFPYTLTAEQLKNSVIQITNDEPIVSTPPTICFTTNSGCWLIVNNCGEKNLVCKANPSDSVSIVIKSESSAYIYCNGEGFINELTVGGDADSWSNYPALRNVDMGTGSTHKIVNLAAPTDDYDAANKKFVTDSVAAWATNQASTDLNMNSKKINNLASPTANNDGASLLTVKGWANYPSAKDIDSNGHKIINLADPLDDYDAANKKFVIEQSSANWSESPAQQMVDINNNYITNLKGVHLPSDSVSNAYFNFMLTASISDGTVPPYIPFTIWPNDLISPRNAYLNATIVSFLPPYSPIKLLFVSKTQIGFPPSYSVESPYYNDIFFLGGSDVSLVNKFLYNIKFNPSVIEFENISSANPGIWEAQICLIYDKDRNKLIDKNLMPEGMILLTGTHQVLNFTINPAPQYPAGISSVDTKIDFDPSPYINTGCFFAFALKMNLLDGGTAPTGSFNLRINQKDSGGSWGLRNPCCYFYKYQMQKG